MSQEKTLQRPNKQDEIEAAGALPEGGPSPLAQQAAAYAQVAREALDDCERGADAHRELERRRNKSGQ